MLPQDLIESVVTALPEIIWPPLPPDHGASLLTLLGYLEYSQWLSPEQLLTHQLNQAVQVIRHARATTVYYGTSLADLDISGPLNQEQWHLLPILSRGDIQGAGDSLVSCRLPSRHGNTFTTQTSGSTGQNVIVRGTDLTQHFWNVLTIRDHLWHRRSLDGTHAIIRMLEDPSASGRLASNWGAPFNSLWRTGTSAVLDLRTDVRLQLEWLVKVSPRYLLTYPSNLTALLELFEASETRLPDLAQVRTIGETLSLELRDRCRQILGVPVVDVYSSQEAGYIALQCPDGDCYHIQAENLLVEVLDDDGAPCAPGKIGRIVITTLHNFAMPLIRYDIGDYAEVGEPCMCGRGLPSLKRIMGRRRNLLTLPTGERFWPAFGIRKFGEIVPVRQYQVIQTAIDRLKVILVTERPTTGDDERQLRDIVRATTGYPFEIDFEFPETIQIIAGKHEEFRSLI